MDEIIENLVAQFSKLPGVGHKTALRFVLHMIKGQKSIVYDLSKALMSIAATRSVEFGLGKKASSLTGWDHNDPITLNEDNKMLYVSRMMPMGDGGSETKIIHEINYSDSERMEISNK